MKKIKNKEKDNRRITIGCLLLIFILIVTLSISFFKTLNSSFSTIPRINEINKYNEKSEGEVRSQFWLRVEGTNIDYPVINGRMDFTQLSEVEGDYLWTNNIYESIPNRLLILGHNIRNLSANPVITDKKHNRFEQLPSFLYYDFAKENKYIQVTSNDGDYLYKIFAVSITEDNELDYYSADYNKEEIAKSIKKTLAESIYDYDIDVKSTDKILSLVTCTRIYGPNSDYDLKIDARMVRKGELTNNYKVSKNKNYEKVEKAMRGDSNDSKA